MNLQQLRYVVATAELGTMTAAAVKLHVAQPALSRAVRALERELRISIFVRCGRGLRLTDEGRGFVAVARRIVADVERLAALGDAPALPVCATTGQARELGASTLARHLDEQGSPVHLAVVDSSAEVFDAVRSGSAEVGIADLPAPPDLEAVSLGWQELVLAHPPGWDLPAPLPVGALEGVPLLVWPHTDWRRGVLESVLRRAGVDPAVAVETTERDLVCRLVAAGAGATVLYGRQAAAVRAAGARLVPFDPPVVREIGVVHAGALTARAEAFVRLLEAESYGELLAAGDHRLAGALRVAGRALVGRIDP